MATNAKVALGERVCVAVPYIVGRECRTGYQPAIYVATIVV